MAQRAEVIEYDTDGGSGDGDGDDDDENDEDRRADNFLGTSASQGLF